MGIFSRSKPKPPETPSGDLDERVRKLESAVRQLEDDFTDLWDRTRRAAGRAAKREQREAPAQIELSPDEEMNQRIRAARAGFNGAGHAVLSEPR